ncbi:hypothetical protein TW81_12935 [Vibrio galatheae]|uniref:DUF2860 domain-containing protein n=1 Tax=Vibrio galatheae TaxID=579748 RepID=A0A0F4NKD1_9VIBR|nr:DUF2860 domain-containing protein [Vibrio galatheae]KJY82496.1 hypothetical protein TW81_12935 [Vibrio galatheae]
MKTIPTLVAFAVMSSSSVSAKLASSAGLSGEISLSAGYISSTSSFNTDTDARISDNTQKGASDSKVLALPLGKLAFTFGRQLDKQIYLGTSREDIAIGTLALEVGYKQQLANGTVIDASLLPTIMSGETWADPFQEDTARSVTNEKGNAYRLKFSNIANSGLSLDTAYAVKDIENEQSGGYNANINNDLLKRDANSLYVKGSFRFPLNRRTFLVPSLIYINTDADGEANSLTSWGSELSLFTAIERHQLALTAGYSGQSYDASHPVYNQTREDEQWKLFAAYEFNQLMGWQNLSLISFAGYGQTDSNIDFYYQQQLILSAGINYKF